MLCSDFSYHLPKELIAQYPPERREDSQLLYLNSSTGAMKDWKFNDLLSLLDPDDLIVFNDTRVIPARLYGSKETGGKVEILVERELNGGKILAQLQSNKAPKSGSQIILENGDSLEIIGRQDEFFVLNIPEHLSLEKLLEKIGHIPLPPYINREDELLDEERYQTIFARNPGAVAAPTVGLHFTEALLEKILAKGCQIGYVTLHVGAGTFQPIRVEDIGQHKMHKERFEINELLCECVEETRQKQGKVVAVGTTVVRSLESAVKNGTLQAMAGETDIFIYPGYEFQLVDALVTNFHLPESTLLMLLCAFAGRNQILTAYKHAIAEKYHFFSYGDAMFTTRTNN